MHARQAGRHTSQCSAIRIQWATYIHSVCFQIWDCYHWHPRWQRWFGRSQWEALQPGLWQSRWQGALSAFPGQISEVLSRRLEVRTYMKESKTACILSRVGEWKMGFTVHYFLFSFLRIIWAGGGWVGGNRDRQKQSSTKFALTGAPGNLAQVYWRCPLSNSSQMLIAWKISLCFQGRRNHRKLVQLAIAFNTDRQLLAKVSEKSPSHPYWGRQDFGRVKICWARCLCKTQAFFDSESSAVGLSSIPEPESHKLWVDLAAAIYNQTTTRQVEFQPPLKPHLSNSFCKLNYGKLLGQM